VYLIFKLGGSEARRRNSPWNQWIADVPGLAYSNLTGEFRNIKDVNVQKISGADGSIDGAAARQSGELLNLCVRLLRRFDFLAIDRQCRQDENSEQQNKPWHIVRNATDRTYHQER
jgi:hypothetical protein